MNKKTKILIGAVVVVLVIIVALAINFPPVFKGESSGTIGKADKYRKSQMTEKDVQLRSELTADTAKLRGMIQGLMYFAVFTNELSTQIDSCVHVFQYRGLTNQEAGYKNMMAMNDFSVFIKNNNKTLGNTISLLSGFYFKDKADQSADVEKDLREFQNYVKTLIEKDSILEEALRSMDKFLVSNKLLKERKSEFNTLKSIRDQLVIKTLQFGALVQDGSLTGTMCSYVIAAEDQFKAVMAQDKLQSYAQDKIQALARDNLARGPLSQERLTAAAQETGFGLISDNLNVSVLAKENLSAITGGILYDKASLQFVPGSREDLAIVTSQAQINAVSAANLNVLEISVVIVLAQDGLKVYATPINLSEAFQLVEIGAVWSNEQLRVIIDAQQNIGIVGALCATALQILI
jgi:hypothetical protein